MYDNDQIVNLLLDVTLIFTHPVPFLAPPFMVVWFSWLHNPPLRGDKGACRVAFRKRKKSANWQISFENIYQCLSISASAVWGPTARLRVEKLRSYARGVQGHVASGKFWKLWKFWKKAFERHLMQYMTLLLCSEGTFMKTIKKQNTQQNQIKVKEECFNSCL